MLLTFLLHTIAMGFKTVNLRGGDLAALQQKTTYSADKGKPVFQDRYILRSII